MHLASSPLGMSAPASPLSGPLQGKMILAPLTRGGNLPFRRLCAAFGMEVRNRRKAVSVDPYGSGCAPVCQR